MRSRIVPVLAFVFLPVVAFGASDSRELSQTFPVEPGQPIRIEIPVAELEIVAADRADLAVELNARCRWQLQECSKALEELELATRSSSRRLTLELLGHSSWRSSILDVEGSIEVPRSSPLHVEMGVADLTLEDFEQDLRVEVGVGKVEARLPKAGYGEALIDVGIGQARFLGADGQPDENRSFLVGTDVHWAEGSGKAEIDIEVGVGEVTVRLQ